MIDIFDEINKELAVIADETRQELIDIEYDEFQEFMHYCFMCEQYERDLEFYEDFYTTVH